MLPTISAAKYHHITEMHNVRMYVDPEEGESLQAILQDLASKLHRGLVLDPNTLRELIELVKKDNLGIPIDNNNIPLEITSAKNYLALNGALSSGELVAQENINIDDRNIKVFFVNSFGRRYGESFSLRGDIDAIVAYVDIDFVSASNKIRRAYTNEERSWIIDKILYRIKDSTNHELVHQSKIINEKIFKGGINESELNRRSPTFRQVYGEESKDKDEDTKKRFLQELAAQLGALFRSKIPEDRAYYEQPDSNPTYHEVAKVIKEILYYEFLQGKGASGWNDSDDELAFISVFGANKIRDTASRLFELIFGAIPDVKSDDMDWGKIREYIKNSIEVKRLVKLLDHELKQIFPGQKEIWFPGNKTIDDLLSYIEEEAKANNLDPQKIKDIKDNIHILAHTFDKEGNEIPIDEKGKKIKEELRAYPIGWLTPNIRIEVLDITRRGSGNEDKSGIDTPLTTKNKSSSSLAVREHKIVPSTTNNPGGIDFHALPIVTQQIKSLQSLSASPLSINPNLDFDQEWSQIQAVFNAGIRPSVQRLVEFSAAAASSPAESQRVEDVLGLIADTLRREEEAQNLTPTDPALKGLLSVLEA